MSKKKNIVNNGLENALGIAEANNPQIMFNNASPYLLSLNWVMLSNTYKSKGFVQTCIDLPVDDAFRNGGFEIDSNTLSADEILKLQEFMSDKKDVETLKDCLRWGRLFGGGVLLCNTKQKADAPFNPETIHNQDVEFVAFDRWQCYPLNSNLAMAEQFMVQDTMHKDVSTGVLVDKSRLRTYTGKTQPYYVRTQLQGWGASVLEQVIPALNSYLKANNVILEMLDEAKIDVLKIFGLSDTLMSAEGERAIRKRIDIASANKNYKSMLAMDSQDDYQQKQLHFGGLDKLVDKIFLMICSCLRIPYSKVFGKGASGFSSGEDDLENYNAMISSEIRVPATSLLKWMIDIRCCQLFGRKVPDLIVKWKPLRILTEKEQQEINSSKINNYIQLANNGIMTKKQVAEKLTNEQIIMFSNEEIKALDDDIDEQEIINAKK